MTVEWAWCNCWILTAQGVHIMKHITLSDLKPSAKGRYRVSLEWTKPVTNLTRCASLIDSNCTIRHEFGKPLLR